MIVTLQQTTLKSEYYEQHKQSRLNYQKRYNQQKEDKKLTEDNTKFSKRDSVVIMSFIKKCKLYTQIPINTTEFVDTSSLTNITHIPFTSNHYKKLVENITKPIIKKSPTPIINIIPNIIILPYEELTTIPQKKVEEVITKRCRICNTKKQPYMFGDNKDKSICDNCNFNTIDMCDKMVTKIIDNIINQVTLTPHQIKRQIHNKTYKEKHSERISLYRKYKYQSNKLIKFYTEYHSSCRVCK